MYISAPIPRKIRLAASAPLGSQPKQVEKFARGTVEDRFSCSRHLLKSTTPVTSRSHPREANDTEEVYEVILRSLKL